LLLSGLLVDSIIALIFVPTNTIYNTTTSPICITSPIPVLHLIMMNDYTWDSAYNSMFWQNPSAIPSLSANYSYTSPPAYSTNTPSAAIGSMAPPSLPIKKNKLSSTSGRQSPVMVDMGSPIEIEDDGEDEDADVDYAFDPRDESDGDGDDVDFDFEPSNPPRTISNGRPAKTTPPIPAYNQGGSTAGTPARSRSTSHQATSSNAQDNISIPRAPPTKAKKRRVQDDPANHQIMRLRTELHYSWQLIANELNEESLKNGGHAHWTTAAVYSRFVRNAPLIAKMQGQTFDTKDWVHLKDEKKTRAKKEAAPTLNRALQLHLRLAVLEAQDSFWDVVADTLHTKTGREFTPEQCAVWYDEIGPGST
jgi:hypothetical protein